MLCRRPFVKDGKAYGCGQCMPCRVNVRRTWTHRIMLEASLHSENCFATLTYSPESLKPSAKSSTTTTKMEVDCPLPSLHKRDLQVWLKRFRKNMEPVRIRFYAVGEYGDQTERPHYHVALFNYPNCLHGNSRYSKLYKNCCINCDRVRDTWGLGNVFLGELSQESANYIAGYVTKKMTGSDDLRLNGRDPEFSLMSRRPGIGADMMDEVASTLMALNLDVTQADVPSSLRHGKRLLPLGRYLKRRLRQRIGRAPEAPKEVIDAIQEDLRPLRESAFDASAPFSEAIIRAADGKVASMESRQRIFKKRNTI